METNLISSKTEREEWARGIEVTMKKAAIMKKNMIKANLTRARAKCPHCDGIWHAVLAGKKNHLHMRCDGTCKTFMME